MPSIPLLLAGFAAGLVLGCTAPEPARTETTISLPYTVQEGEQVVRFAASKAWKPAWSDSLIARLERGAIPAYDQDNQPLPADALPPHRRVRGLVLEAGPDGALRDDGTLLLPPRSVLGIVPPGARPGTLDFYFYDQSVSLEHFYARVQLAEIERLTGTRLAFVASK